jgi:hypothetical protein
LVKLAVYAVLRGAKPSIRVRQTILLSADRVIE